MSEKSKKEAGRKAAKPRAGVAAAARNAAREIKKTPVFDDVSPQKKLREALRSLLPRVFADGRLDIDALCESLGESRESVARERYRFEWVGRADSVRLLEQNPALALRPCRGESVDFEATRNLYLEGDNLSVLRLLNRAYAGRVKMIYIDPPYNTGNDFVYNDKFGESFATYEARAGEAESAGAREESKRNGANRHSFWLSMMFPRLLLARDLLRDDGVIFVSIDDNEVHHLRLLLNAVFGEENFVGELIHQRAKGGGNAKGVVKGHDYIVVYAKMKADDSQLRRKKVVQGKTVEKDGVKYIVDDDVVRKVFGKYSGKDDRRCFYEELLEFKSPEKKREVDEAILAGRYFLKPHKSGKNMICRLIPVDKARSKLYSIIKVLSEKGSQDIESLGIVYDDYPKPVELLRQLVDSASTRSGRYCHGFLFGIGNDRARRYGIKRRRRRHASMRFGAIARRGRRKKRNAQSGIRNHRRPRQRTPAPRGPKNTRSQKRRRRNGYWLSGFQNRPRGFAPPHLGGKSDAPKTPQNGKRRSATLRNCACRGLVFDRANRGEKNRQKHGASNIRCAERPPFAHLLGFENRRRFSAQNDRGKRRNRHLPRRRDERRNRAQPVVSL